MQPALHTLSILTRSYLFLVMNVTYLKSTHTFAYAKLFLRCQSGSLRGHPRYLNQRDWTKERRTNEQQLQIDPLQTRFRHSRAHSWKLENMDSHHMNVCMSMWIICHTVGYGTGKTFLFIRNTEQCKQ